MLKWILAALLTLITLWLALQKSHLNWAFLISGFIVGSTSCLLLFASKKELPTKIISDPEKVAQELMWQKRLEQIEKERRQTTDQLHQEMEKLRQKSIQSESRCVSYQNLVQVHQQEIEKLRQEHQMLTQKLIEKEQKLSSSYLKQLEPDLFT